MKRLLLTCLLVAGFTIPGLAASPLAALPYNLVLSPRPTSSSAAGAVVGQFGGVPVAGTYNGNSSSGTLTLTVQGAAFVQGAYSCSYSGCAFTGTVADKRVLAMPMSGLHGVGQAVSSVFPHRDAWVSAVSAWASTHLRSDQGATIVSAAASLKMLPAPYDQGSGSGHGSESGRDGMGGGGDMGGSGMGK